MNTTQRITKTAQALGYTVSSEFGGELVARNSQGEARMSATIADGRFCGGYTTDRMGHVVSHRTVRDFIETGVNGEYGPLQVWLPGSAGYPAEVSFPDDFWRGGRADLVAMRDLLDLAIRTMDEGAE